MECCAGAACNIASKQAALSVKVANEEAAQACKGKYRITPDRTQLVVDEGCEGAKFLVQTIDRKLRLDVFKKI